MIIGLSLFYVGAVLFINGIWLLGKIENKEVAVINVMVGTLSLFISGYLVLQDPNDPSLISAGAFTLLFAFTYLWVGANQFLNNDGRGLGWFCLFVSVTAGLIAIGSTLHIDSRFDAWDTANWFAWAMLWFSYFVLLALKRDIQKAVALYTLFCAIATGWIPGIMILQGLIVL
ncbi:AmiS/UreI family transporter [Halomonas sp. V046]|uniref:AmiS/UreI family transporter n=1 Tax=Halomonas sp. V046 TaxID=3459611 RepID=UPI004044590D